MFDVLIKSHDIDKRVIEVVLYIVFPLSFSCRDVSYMVTLTPPVEQLCEGKVADIFCKVWFKSLMLRFR